MSEYRFTSSAIYQHNVDYMLDATDQFFTATPDAPQYMINPDLTEGIPVLCRSLDCNGSLLNETVILDQKAAAHLPDHQRLYVAVVTEEALLSASLSQSGQVRMGQAPLIPDDPIAQQAVLDNSRISVPYSVADEGFNVLENTYSIENAASLLNRVLARFRRTRIREMLHDFDTSLKPL